MSSTFLIWEEIGRISTKYKDKAKNLKKDDKMRIVFYSLTLFIYYINVISKGTLKITEKELITTMIIIAVITTKVLISLILLRDAYCKCHGLASMDLLVCSASNSLKQSNLIPEKVLLDNKTLNIESNFVKLHFID